MSKINPNTLSRKIREDTEREISENKLACKEVVVHQNGEEVYGEVFGTSSVGGAPARKGMLYRIASMTKPITSAAVLTLIDRGLLALDDRVSKFYPQAASLKIAEITDGKITGYRTSGKELTVRNLLSHTNGIDCLPLNRIVGPTLLDATLAEAVDDILSRPIAFEPDSEQSYSETGGFDIAAGIVQLITGRPYDEYLKETLFDPLGMVNTTFAPTAGQRENFVTVFDRTEDGRGTNVRMPDGCVFDNFTYRRMPAGAGLASTAEDYIKFADMLCAGGKTPDGRTILTEKAVKMMSSPQIPDSIDMGFIKWGLGVRVITSENHPFGLGVGCFGWSGAYGTHFWVDPVNGVTAVMMKNSDYDGGSDNHSSHDLEMAVAEALR